MSVLWNVKNWGTWDVTTSHFCQEEDPANWSYLNMLEKWFIHLSCPIQSGPAIPAVPYLGHWTEHSRDRRVFYLFQFHSNCCSSTTQESWTQVAFHPTLMKSLGIFHRGVQEEIQQRLLSWSICKVLVGEQVWTLTFFREVPIEEEHMVGWVWLFHSLDTNNILSENIWWKRDHIRTLRSWMSRQSRTIHFGSANYDTFSEGREKKCWVKLVRQRKTWAVQLKDTSTFHTGWILLLEYFQLHHCAFSHWKLPNDGLWNIGQRCRQQRWGELFSCWSMMSRSVMMR